MRTRNVLAVLLSIVYHIGRREVETIRCQKTSTNERNFPFLQTDTERWAFEEQMKLKMREYMTAVQNSAIKYLYEKSLRKAKIVDIERAVITQKTKGKEWRGTLYLKNGWAEDLSKLSIFGEEILEYKNLEMIYKSQMKLWDFLKITHDFSILKNKSGFRGKIVSLLKGFQFSIEALLDFKKKTFVLENFRLECVSEINVNMTGLRKELNWLIVGIKEVVTDVYKGSVFEDLQGTMQTAFEDGIEEVKIAYYLPEFNYDEEFDQVMGKKETMNKEYEKKGTITEEIHEASLTNDPGDVDLTTSNFIQNEAEMWSFRIQIKERMNEYLDNLIIYINKLLTERRLERARMPDYSCVFEVTDPENTKLYAKISLENGSVIGVNNMMIMSGIERMEFSKNEIAFTTHVRLLDRVQFDQNFTFDVNRTEHTGSVRGLVESVTYLLKFAVKLDKSIAAMKMAQLLGISGVALEVKGLGDGKEWVSEQVKSAALEVFRGPIWHDMDAIIRKAFNHSITVNYIWRYLPKWSYKRNYKVRRDNANEEMRTLCERNVLETITAKQQGGNFTAVSHAPVPFIDTEAHRWYFEKLLKNSISEYMNKVMHDASNTVAERNLSKAKMSECVKNFSVENEGKTTWDGNLTFTDCWVTGLSPIGKGVVDQISYDSTEIVITTKNLIWWNMQFNGDFFLNTSQAQIKGKIDGNIHSMIYNIEMRVDYLISKAVILEELNMHCLGGIAVNARVNDDAVDDLVVGHISDIAADVFKTEFLKDVEMILRRSIEDSISKNNISWFLPKWDYRNDYKDSNIAMRNMLPNKFNNCPVNLKEELKIDLHEDEKVVEYKHYLPSVEIAALRGSFNEQMVPKIGRYIGIFITGLNFNPPIDLYVTTKLMEHAQTFDYKDNLGVGHNLSLSLFNGSMHNLTPAYDFDLQDMKYGEKGSILLLHSQSWYQFQIMYRLIIRFDNIVLKGKILGIVKTPLAVLRSRFDMPAKKFVIEDYNIHCVSDFNLDLQVREIEEYWPVTEVLNRIRKIFHESVMDEAVSLLLHSYEKTVNTQSNFIKYFMPDWIYYDTIHNLAVQKMDYSIKPLDELQKGCAIHHKDEPHTPYQGHLPFIRTETEWWSFEKELKEGLRKYSARIRDHAYNFLQNNFLDTSQLPMFTTPFSCRDDNVLVWKGDLNLEGGWAQNLSSFSYNFMDLLEYHGREISMTTPINFNGILKLHYDFNTNLINESVSGFVEAYVPSLTYMATVHIDLKTKQAKLVDFDLECTGDFGVEVYGLPAEFEWMHHGILNATTSVFSLLFHRDIQQLMHMALEYGVLYYPDMGEYVPERKYDKNFMPMGNNPKYRQRGEIQTCVEKIHQ